MRSTLRIAGHAANETPACVLCLIVMDLSVTGLRVLREVAERGSFTAAAAALGYTQSAVSRQIAALEHVTRAKVFDRLPGGVQLTPAGRMLLRHAAVALDVLDTAARELEGLPADGGPVRLGAFASAGTVLIPRAVAALRRNHPEIDVTTREGTTPALVRALRAGTVDLAVLAQSPPFRPPDAETPPLMLETISEVSLQIAVPAGHPFAGRDSVRVAELRGQRWIASRSSGEETRLGVWPGLDERPRIAHVARDWLSKLQLVAAGAGLTTIPALMAPALPPGVRLVAVADGPRELRRMVLARLPGRPAPALVQVQRALRAAASGSPMPP
jgi:DNA-binding transcriptional LysR family regulator